MACICILSSSGVCCGRDVLGRTLSEPTSLRAMGGEWGSVLRWYARSSSSTADKVWGESTAGPSAISSFTLPRAGKGWEDVETKDREDPKGQTDRESHPREQQSMVHVLLVEDDPGHGALIRGVIEHLADAIEHVATGLPRPPGESTKAASSSGRVGRSRRSAAPSRSAPPASERSSSRARPGLGRSSSPWPSTGQAGGRAGRSYR